MISKQQQKYVQSLHNKKFRTEFNHFLVEGEKGILELFDSDFEIVDLYCSPFLKDKVLGRKPAQSLCVCAPAVLASISTLKTNTAGVAVVKQKEKRTLPHSLSGVILLLDDINDPGNLGTIIRLADWYGIENLVCSKNCVEFYNPKVISATMGSFCRVNCFSEDLAVVINNLNMPVYGAFLEGENVHTQLFESTMALVIGSESHGISPAIASLVTKKITIPRIGKAESLNAGIATAIILDNVFR
jgi:RNA methyltransferase, TrmH family